MTIGYRKPLKIKIEFACISFLLFYPGLRSGVGGGEGVVITERKRDLNRNT